MMKRDEEASDLRAQLQLLQRSPPPPSPTTPPLNKRSRADTTATPAKPQPKRSRATSPTPPPPERQEPGWTIVERKSRGTQTRTARPDPSPTWAEVVKAGNTTKGGFTIFLQIPAADPRSQRRPQRRTKKKNEIADSKRGKASGPQAGLPTADCVERTGLAKAPPKKSSTTDGCGLLGSV
ncbi:hypothetical protein EDC01DRAFT_664107, partial [Geopyxis carbonaria]